MITKTYVLVKCAKGTVLVAHLSFGYILSPYYFKFFATLFEYQHLMNLSTSNQASENSIQKKQESKLFSPVLLLKLCQKNRPPSYPGYPWLEFRMIVFEFPSVYGCTVTVPFCFFKGNVFVVYMLAKCFSADFSCF
jgi:hypothetical protein